MRQLKIKFANMRHENIFLIADPLYLAIRQDATNSILINIYYIEPKNKGGALARFLHQEPLQAFNGLALIYKKRARGYGNERRSGDPGAQAG